ncbi:hypothetical protein [Staphylococcus agnetis]|uniref:hypothetical protein n=1 Tax=Staphylococcus agnetis TaxID=985762 RepID=UPI0021CE3D19|nr:hypothetical protein [Staphylococcus agnetis]UXU60237.1 hypothetical protein MUA97_03580 [Staphylococcus agnetis]UXU62568.1 hypothetical protein MUA43_03580 [Staphylococcus agnetis]UXU65164.1 hypothetical protein MUA84_05315 [Staphylococcus agnetis]
MYKKSFVILSILFLLTACNKADEKVKGVWKYTYNDYQSLSLRVENEEMFVRFKGLEQEVFPLKKSDENDFRFVVQGQNDSSEYYMFSVHIEPDDYISVEPMSQNQKSLACILLKEKDLSKKAQKESIIQLKKVE